MVTGESLSLTYAQQTYASAYKNMHAHIHRVEDDIKLHDTRGGVCK